MNEKMLTRLLWFFTAINIIYLFASIFISRRAMGDDLEHIHASWLVWQGYVPYTDFFEHHNPLMWYMFAPLVGFFSGNVLVFLYIRCIIAAVSLLTLYIIYRLIKDFWSNKTAALLAINIFCFSNTAMDAMVQFKPDAFMQLFFFIGLYFFFAFLRDAKQKYLNYAALSWAVGFLFLQTIIFLILPLGLYGIYLLAAKKLSWKNIALALPWLLTPLVLFGIYLFACGNAQRYFETNWLLNSHILEHIWNRRIHEFSDLYSVLALGAAAAIYLLLKKPDRYTAILLIMYAVEFALRTLYISMWMYYFKILILYNAVLIAMVCAKIYNAKKWTAWLALPVLLICCGKFWLFEGIVPDEIDTLKVLQVSTHIAQNTTPDDIVLGLPGIPFGIFNKNPHYYWFSWSYMGELDNKYFHYTEPFDINKVIAETKPKYIYYEEYKKKKPEKRPPYAIVPQQLYTEYRQEVFDTLFRRRHDD